MEGICCFGWGNICAVPWPRGGVAVSADLIRTINRVNVERTDNHFNVQIEKNQVAVRRFDVLNVYLGSSGDTVSVVASEALGGHRVVTFDGYYASNDDADDRFSVLGITTGAVVIGATATVKTYGTITEGSWNWTAGLPVFLSTNGQLTQTAPTAGFRLIIGRAKSATTLFVDISEPIVLI